MGKKKFLREKKRCFKFLNSPMQYGGTAASFFFGITFYVLMVILIIKIKNLWMDVWCSAVCFVLIDCIWPIKLGEAEENIFFFLKCRMFQIHF